MHPSHAGRGIGRRLLTLRTTRCVLPVAWKRSSSCTNRRSGVSSDERRVRAIRVAKVRLSTLKRFASAYPGALVATSSNQEAATAPRWSARLRAGGQGSIRGCRPQ